MKLTTTIILSLFTVCCAAAEDFKPLPSTIAFHKSVDDAEKKLNHDKLVASVAYKKELVKEINARVKLNPNENIDAISLEMQNVNDEIDNLTGMDDTNSFHVISAKYGSGDKFVDVTPTLNKMVKEGYLNFTNTAYGTVFPDPTPNIAKQLIIKWIVINEEVRTNTYKENQRFSIGIIPQPKPVVKK